MGGGIQVEDLGEVVVADRVPGAVGELLDAGKAGLVCAKEAGGSGVWFVDHGR